MRAVFPLRWALAAGIAAWGGLFLTLAAAQPGEPTKVGTVMDSMQNRWVLNATGHLDRGSLPIRRGMALSLQVDGRSYSLSPASSSSTGKSEGEKEPELPKELKADARFIYRFPEDVGLKWVRYVRVDAERRGVRFLDVIENTSKQPRSLLLRFQNEMDVPDSDFFQGAATDRGVIISRESPMLADDTSGVILQFSPELSPAMPMFLFGKTSDPWTEERRVESYQLKLERTGSLEPGKRAVFIHWIASKRPQEKGKAEKVFERFYADGRLVDPGVPEDLQKDVVNFPAAAFLPAEEKKGGTPLVMLERLTKRLKVEVGAADLLLLEPGSVVTGSLKSSKLMLERGGKSMDLAQAEIAAISGGAGRGREHQVFLRDGTVLTGRISMEGGKFKSDGVGEVSLNVGTMYHLILKSAAGEGASVTPSKGVLVTHRGELLRLAALPPTPLTIRMVAGAYGLNWEEVAFIHERGEPDLGYDVGLKDGSQLVGLPIWGDSKWSVVRDQEVSPSEGVQMFAAEGQDVEELLSAERSDEDRPVGGWCALLHGVIWAGAPGEGTVSMEAAGGITEFKATEIRSVRRNGDDLPATGASALFDVELAGGLKMRGRFTTPTLKWQRGGRVMELLWSRVTELKIERAEP